MISFKNYLLEAYNIHINKSDDKGIQKLIDYLQELNNIEYPIVKDNKSEKYKIKRVYEPFKDDIENFINTNNVNIKWSFGNGSISKNMNSLGKALSDAGEIATIKSLQKEINTPEDTEQEIFINNPESFNAWKLTFIETKKAINQIINDDIKKYKIIHDATDTSEFSKIISKFTKKIGTSKDSWNPADIFLIRKDKYDYVIKKLNLILELKVDKNTLISLFNNEIYSLYEKGILYPISLKQLKSSAKIELSNTPEQEIHFYDIKINNFNLDFSLKSGTKEIGIMSFLNKETKGIISMQNRPFPYGYSITQTEITSDGTKTGGRLGKVPTKIIDQIMGEYNFGRIKSTKYFGDKRDMLKNFDKTKQQEVIEMYKLVSSNKNVKSIRVKPEEIIQQAFNGNDTDKINFMLKVQGLFFMYFFIKNEKNISDIINKFILGAKKINPQSGFFIKIY